MKTVNVLRDLPAHLWALFHCVLWSLCVLQAASAEDSLQSIDCLIEPYQTIDLSTAVTGIIQDVELERGDLVEKNQVVARLHSEVEKTRVELAKFRAESMADIELRREKLSFAQRNRTRLIDLSKKNLVSAQEKDAVDTEWRLSRHELRKAKQQQEIYKLEHANAVANLAERTITSPIDGVVVDRFLSPGEYVENRPIIRIAQINPLLVTVVAPVSFFGKINLEDQASIVLENMQGTERSAKVVMLDKVIDAASGTFVIRLELSNEANQIPSGLSCQAKFKG